MTHWEVLGINRDADKKTIKRAYAKLLKHNKPDENPEGFERLHSSYQYCLRNIILPEQAVEVVEEEVQSDVEPTTEITSHIEPDNEPPAHIAVDDNSVQDDIEIIDTPLLNVHDPIIEEKSEEEQAREAERLKTAQHVEKLRQHWPVLAEQLTAAIETLEHTDNLDHWLFLENDEALYDIEFKHEFSHYVFECLLDFFADKQALASKQHKVLRYLNRLFRWTENDQQLEYFYNRQYTDTFLTLLSDIESRPEERKLQWACPKRHNGPLVPVNSFVRIAAAMIDMIVIYMVCGTLFADQGEAIVRSIVAYMC